MISCVGAVGSSEPAAPFACDGRDIGESCPGLSERAATESPPPKEFYRSSGDQVECFLVENARFPTLRLTHFPTHGHKLTRHMCAAMVGVRLCNDTVVRNPIERRANARVRFRSHTGHSPQEFNLFSLDSPYGCRCTVPCRVAAPVNADSAKPMRPVTVCTRLALGRGRHRGSDKAVGPTGRGCVLETDVGGLPDSEQASGFGDGVGAPRLGFPALMLPGPL